MGTACRYIIRTFVVIALGAPLLGCESEAERQREEGLRAVDSIAAARARGEIDLANPEMGAKIGVTLSEWAIELSHDSIGKGQATFSVQNKGTMAHALQISGPGGNWKSQPIPPNGGYVLMSMIIDPGEYELSVPDSAGAHKERGMVNKIMVR